MAAPNGDPEMEVQKGRCTWYPGDICHSCMRPKSNQKCLCADFVEVPKGSQLSKQRPYQSLTVLH